MITVVFENSAMERRKIAEVESIQEALAAINQFLTDHNYKPSYWRLWDENDEIAVDVGSHCEFFYCLVPDDFNLSAAMFPN